jgi:hypothetical protein
MHTIEALNIVKPKNSKLTAISFAQPHIQPGGAPVRMINCICACGNTKIVRIANFLSITRSCGCLFIEANKSKNGKNRSPFPFKLRCCYWSMMARCYYPKSRSYKVYGGMGVSVCDEWKGKLDVFCKWALSNGWEPRLQLDKDIKGDGKLYSPNNCCFVTAKINSRNKKNTIRVEYDGDIITIGELSDRVKIDYHFLYKRIVDRGLTAEQALEKYDEQQWDEMVSNLIKLKMPEMETDQYKLLVYTASDIINKIIAQ